MTEVKIATRRADTNCACQQLFVTRHTLVSDKSWARCAVGHGGLKRDKIEGDGATPIGQFPLRRLLFRPDRIRFVDTCLPITAMRPDDGWCDDPSDPAYNTMVKLPYSGHFEKLWRNDQLYDVLVVIGYNDMPVVLGKGSAIFLHVARPDYNPTDGCVAIELHALCEIVSRCSSSTTIDIR